MEEERQPGWERDPRAGDPAGEEPALSSASGLGRQLRPTSRGGGGSVRLEEEKLAELLPRTHRRLCNPLVPSLRTGLLVVQCVPDTADRRGSRITRCWPLGKQATTD